MNRIGGRDYNMGLFIGCTCDWDADETCDECNPDNYPERPFDPKTDPHVLLDKNVPEFKESDRKGYREAQSEILFKGPNAQAAAQKFIDDYNNHKTPGSKWFPKLDEDLKKLSNHDNGSGYVPEVLAKNFATQKYYEGYSEGAATRDMNTEGHVKKEKKPINVGDSVTFAAVNAGSGVFQKVIETRVSLSGTIYVLEMMNFDKTKHIEILRCNVIRVKRKKKKVPVIVWTTTGQLKRLSEGKDGCLYSSGFFTTKEDVPLRPLTEKERKRFGV